MKTDYAAFLRRKTEEHKENIEAPISLLQYKARMDRQRWLERLSKIMKEKHDLT